MWISDAIKAVKAGEELSDSAGWKNKQITANVLAVFIGAALAVAKAFGFSALDGLTADDITVVAGAGAVLLFMLNSYLTAATSKKVGL